MSLDTKYRPIRYEDVLGQDATKKILKQFVKTGRGFHQSYLFAGAFGSGKTTLGRILARALLCDAPTQEGEPCNECPSCQEILATGASESFVEVDAATNSGKAEITQITQELDYSTFSGKRKLYLFDEAHQLSSQALDALLKPLEENTPGTEDKKLVCLFCTTEPEKMRDTILSRCAPAFIIEPVEPATIAENLLAKVCDAEGLVYEPDMLRLIAEVTECHIRDALKAIEGISMLGPISQENVMAYLHLDTNSMYLDLLDCLSTDAPAAMDLALTLLGRSSPTTIYQRLADACMAAYRKYLGVRKPDLYWDTAKMERLSQLGEALLVYASRFSSRPARPSASMLLCDLASLNRGIPANAQMVMVAPTKVQPAPTGPALVGPQVVAPTPNPAHHPEGSTFSDFSGNMPELPSVKNGVYVDPRAVNTGKTFSLTSHQTRSDDLASDEFARLLALRLCELDEGVRGQTGRQYMGGH